MCAFIIKYYEDRKNYILPNCYIATTAHVFVCDSPPCVFILVETYNNIDIVFI